ncbi:MAG: 1-(5-phosphoribosyl)-5-[(5-phosphoribosylamino)methylideneamino] imidazole-4-carboxamide isomerase [Gemmatimonadota bacterium]|nr:1-(5-phosphoribosyl)-5-[(5-phosphoribosylamino)methylideneamino] imidazole-4-carboxamide isomerase [Gemmatimonadota bacterium]
MIALPAVDLRRGRCVQLVGGRPEKEKISLPAASNVALSWWQAGFEQLHVVDLDAALGHGNNDELVGEVVAASPAETQVGGGVRTDERVDLLFACGAGRIVVGTRAVDDPDWIGGLAKRYPGRILVAADVRERTVLRKGWTEASKLKVEVFLEGLSELPLAGVLCTDVDREGRMEGIDLAEMSTVIRASTHPVQVSGGITSLDDLDTLADAGAAAAVLGMALYTGRLDPAEVARKYGGMT